MATKTATAASSTRPARANLGVNSISSKYTCNGATISAGDVIQMVRVPRGANILSVAISRGPGLATVHVGDGVSASRYMSDTSISPTLARTELTKYTGHGYSYSAEDTIDVTVSATTTATATGSLQMTVIYTLDP